MVDVDSVVQPMLGHIIQLVYSFALQMLMCIVQCCLSAMVLGYV